MIKNQVIIFLLLKCFFSNQYDTSNLELIYYEDLNQLINNLKTSKSMKDVMKIENVFDKFQIPQRPICDYQNKKLCDSYLIEIADFSKGENYVKKMPTILLIAGFHGNEVIGTNTFYYFLESFNKHFLKNQYYNTLIKNVRILILPTANVNGFARQQREENLGYYSYDPNRDFPFNLQYENDKCFKTSTAMIIDQIFRNNLIIGSFTFHGGDNSISYPWGNFAHQQDPLTGDNIAFDQVARKFQQIAGGNKNLDIEKYKIGNLQSTVYDVFGGFEDWAYGASNDKKNVPKQCSMYENYQIAQRGIQYDDQSNRCFIYLVEAGYRKIPKKGTLGNELSFYEPDNKKSIYGHLARNIKLSLSFAEMMSPYLTLEQIKYDNDLNLQFLLRGCLTLDEFQVDQISKENYQFSQQQIKNSNNIKIQVSIKNVNEDIKQLSFNYTCDQNWKTQFEHKQHQAHFVKMRIQDNYDVNYKGYSIKSQKKMQSHLLNINLQNIKQSSIYQVQKHVINLINSNFIKAVTNDNVIKLSINDKDQISSDDHHCKIIVHSLTSKKQQPRHLMLLKENQNLSKQNFYDLVGTQIQIEDENGNNQKGSFQIDQDSSLFIPYNGLMVKKLLNFGMYFIEIIPQELTKLKFLVKFNGKLPKSLSIGNLSLNLPNEIKKEKNYNLLVREFEIKITDLNMFRFLGQKIKVYDENGDQIFEEFLVQRNSYIQNYKEEFFNTQNKFNSFTQNKKSDNLFYSEFLFSVLVMIILFTALTVVFLHKKKMNKMKAIETQVLNEMEIIDI